VFLSSVTLAELLFGIGALPTGKRKKMLADALDGCCVCSPITSCRSTPMQRAAMPPWPSQAALPVEAFRCPMATLQPSQVRAASSWPRAIPRPMRPLACTSSTLGRWHQAFVAWRSRWKR
jgi:hypothetical protein